MEVATLSDIKLTLLLVNCVKILLYSGPCYIQNIKNTGCMKLQYAVTLIREFSDEREEAAKVKHCT